MPLLAADDKRCARRHDADGGAARSGTGRFGAGQAAHAAAPTARLASGQGPGARRSSSSRCTPPGREAACDFTHATELGVTIAGRIFEHLLVSSSF